MGEGERKKSLNNVVVRLVESLLGLPWARIVEQLWEAGQALLERARKTGDYEILAYESTLELLDVAGKRAIFNKRMQVRYLRGETFTFRDYAWADGKNLVGYKTDTGKPVDRYRSGYKTYIVISLRKVRKRGDVDDFHIRWRLRDSFLKEDGYWSTGVTHKIHYLDVRIVFPKERPPVQVFLDEHNQRRTQKIAGRAIEYQKDGRVLVRWEKKKPRLHELYTICWLW